MPAPTYAPFSVPSYAPSGAAPASFSPVDDTPSSVAPAVFSPTGDTPSGVAPVRFFASAERVSAVVLLKARATAQVPTDETAFMWVGTQLWMLYRGNAVENLSGSPAIALPNDYNDSLNPRYWQAVPEVSPIYKTLVDQSAAQFADASGNTFFG